MKSREFENKMSCSDESAEDVSDLDASISSSLLANELNGLVQSSHQLKHLNRVKRRLAETLESDKVRASIHHQRRNLTCIKRRNLTCVIISYIFHHILDYYSFDELTLLVHLKDLCVLSSIFYSVENGREFMTAT